MIPRKPLATWQHFAQACGRCETGFAPDAGLRDDRVVLGALPAPQRFGQDCYPFPTLWPDSDGVRPFFATAAGRLWRLVASGVGNRVFRFALLPDFVESALRTTTKRGSSKCGNHLSFSPFSPRWLAVCKTRLRAVWQVRLRVLRLLMSPTTMRSPALSLAALPGLQPAASIWACRPATDLSAASAAYGLTASRGHPRLAVLFCAFWPGREGESAYV